jgi:DNA-binding NarL/FixJ family response regulator
MPGTASVLIVEDEKLARWALHQKLTAMPQLVVSDAASAEELLAMVKTQAFDLILLDIGLPGISGMEALSLLKAQGCQAAIIMVTAHDENDLIMQALRLGAADFIVTCRSSPVSRIRRAAPPPWPSLSANRQRSRNCASKCSASARVRP